MSYRDIEVIGQTYKVGAGIKALDMPILVADLRWTFSPSKPYYLNNEKIHARAATN